MLSKMPPSSLNFHPNKIRNAPHYLMILFSRNLLANMDQIYYIYTNVFMHVMTLFIINDLKEIN
jgi:hypothetical protein